MSRGSDMDRLRRNLRAAPERIRSTATKAVLSALEKSVDSGYKTRTDVNGRPYLPPKDGHMPPMERTGELRKGYAYSAMAGALYILIKVVEYTKYGRYLRDGTPKMEPRQHIPRPFEALPPSWAARIQAGLGEAMRREEARAA